MKIRGSFPSQKVMSFVALATFMVHILSSLLVIKSAFADGGSLTFTDDISNIPVQSDTVIITGSWTAITDARWLYASDCTGVDFSTGTVFDIVNIEDVSTTITINNESHNGEYICAWLTDSGSPIYGQSINTVHIDTTPPIIDIVGDNPETVLSWSTYVDSWATWTDSMDGSGIISTANSGSVDNNNSGTYLLEYLYSDTAGNIGSAIRTVNVIDGWW
jgi:hypothetical protein